jgi:hypothetical protein
VRRLLASILLVSAAAAATLALGPAFGAGPVSAEPPQAPAAAGHGLHLKAKPSPLAGLDRTFRAILPAARCDAGAAKRRAASRLRTAALKGARKAPPKVVRRKKATMRRAIALLRSARTLCREAAPPGGATGTPPPPPPPAGLQKITLHVTPGQPLRFAEAPTATAGAMRLELVNGSSLSHFVGVRLGSGQPTIGESPLASPGETEFVDVTLAAGTYQVFCRNNGHDQQGMTTTLTVNP